MGCFDIEPPLSTKVRSTCAGGPDVANTNHKTLLQSLLKPSAHMYRPLPCSHPTAHPISSL